MKIKYAPQNGGPARINNQGIPQYLNQTPNKQTEQRIKLEQESHIPSPKKSLLKKTLPYLLPTLGTGTAVGLPFIL